MTLILIRWLRRIAKVDLPAPGEPITKIFFIRQKAKRKRGLRAGLSPLNNFVR
jgi:hypothetical protein